MVQVVIREMAVGEEARVHAIGRRAFQGFESLWVPKPKQALVAVSDGEIVGAVLYKLMQAGDRKVGYIDYAFMDPVHDGKGYGSVLYKEAIAHLWRLGCDAQTALVKDDNVGSWHLFDKNGFRRVTLLELARLFGLGGAVRQYFTTPFCVGVGMGFHVAEKNGETGQKRHGNLGPFAAYLLVNALLMLLGKSANGYKALYAVGALLIVLMAGMLGEYLGTRLSAERKWSFRYYNGGLLVCAAIMVLSVFPMIGRFYPASYDKTSRFRRDMGISAWFGWMATLLVTAASVFFFKEWVLFANMGSIGVLLLLYRSIPIYPFESFGGARVLAWSKPLYWVMVIVSVATTACAWFL